MKPEDIRRLHQKKHRDELGLFLVEGEHPVRELIRAAQHDVRLRTSEIHCTQEHASITTQLAVHVVNSRQMAQLSETRSPQGIVAVVPKPLPVAPSADERAIYLHEIQDPGNLGTILRTLAWFGGFRCLLGPDSVDPFNGKVVRASMGAIFHVPLETGVTLQSLGARFQRIAALDLQGTSISSPAFRDFRCYLFGNEARGLPQPDLQTLGAEQFSIAGTGAVDSLNVAAAVTISQYELHRPPAA